MLCDDFAQTIEKTWTEAPINNTGIESFFYVPFPTSLSLRKEYRAQEKQLQIKWRLRKEMVQTPLGEVIMYWDVPSRSFHYFCNVSLPQSVIYAIAKQYCHTFHCRDFFTDEHSMLPDIWPSDTPLRVDPDLPPTVSTGVPDSDAHLYVQRKPSTAVALSSPPLPPKKVPIVIRKGRIEDAEAPISEPIFKFPCTLAPSKYDAMFAKEDPEEEEEEQQQKEGEGGTATGANMSYSEWKKKVAIIPPATD
jgi:hypothetical protein